ncbi:FecCD family ABC transporter permease [Tumebacillus permanentifrigoris]|uniref:Iron complex transport system permease protein n=1 Tax=Tumebacillus permanentifrigoris TaxID=378543 RepID=A0A316D6M0_9BACL|nr:iron ABC transporter permease [Tumebacillus permanentifrigoris]PWK09627.1 iron complex transport system permease protein [Tumebacillus permanentifrigoris]
MTVLLQKNQSKLGGLLLLLLLVIAGMFASILWGVVDTSWQGLLQTYTHFTGTQEQLVIQQIRVPRALIATAIGASLGVSGVLMQVLMRNPLADPGVFGVNAGASFFVVVAITLFSMTSLTEIAWVAFLGAAVSGGIVYTLGSLGRDGLTPMKLTIAGAAMAALFSSWMHGLLIVNERAMEDVLFWIAGSVSGRKLELLTSVLPYLAVGWIGSILLTGQLNILSSGDDIAKGLGQKTWLIKLLSALCVVLLAGGSVAVAGPVGFIGLVIPHFARALVGLNLRWVMLYAMLLGALFVLTADIAARFVAMPKEVPLGVMTALLGVPFFVYVARKGVTRS